MISFELTKDGEELARALWHEEDDVIDMLALWANDDNADHLVRKFASANCGSEWHSKVPGFLRQLADRMENGS